MTRTAAGVETMGLRIHALQQTRTLLRRFAFQVNRAARAADAEAVHDLRVSIRRLSQCLRVFDPLYPDGQARKIRRKLKTIMRAASDVRDPDVTLELMRKAGIPKTSRAVPAVGKERKQAERQLAEAIRTSGKDNISRKWRAKLGL